MNLFPHSNDIFSKDILSSKKLVFTQQMCLFIEYIAWPFFDIGYYCCLGRLFSCIPFVIMYFVIIYTKFFADIGHELNNRFGFGVGSSLNLMPRFFGNSRQYIVSNALVSLCSGYIFLVQLCCSRLVCCVVDY